MDTNVAQVFKAFLFLTLLLSGACARAQAPAKYVWIEGEATSAINIRPTIAGWGRKEFLSEEKWLHVNIEADDVDKQMPPGGVQITYRFLLLKAGKHAIWNRVGFEWVRSPFEWRVDDGPWSLARPDDLTTDLMELQKWTEVAWLKLGEVPLTAGAHTLEIRLSKTVEPAGKNQGKTAKIVYASDAILIHNGTFFPDGKRKPGEEASDARDHQAALQRFALPEPATPGARAFVALKGLWQVARHDEQAPGPTAQPIRDFPPEPHWKAIPVPGDKNKERPDLVFAHRLWYRTRVNVPRSQAGRSFFLLFPQNNLNTTVYVNGVYCGFNKNPFARFQIDVTKGVKPGVNEVWVGIRDAWYGYSANPDTPLKLRRKFNTPIDYFAEGFQDLAYPIWNHPQSGILATPVFVAAGAVYAADVFAKPSVATKTLAAEVTLANPTDKQVAGRIEWQAVDPQSSVVEKTFAARPFTLAPGAEQTLNLSQAWPNPKLWWPDDPHQYHLRTTIRVDSSVLDVADTPFGFREWGTQNKHFTLNGVRWHGWADTFTADTPQAWLAFYRKTNQRMMRFWGTRWMDLPPDEALDFFDQHGVVVRRSGLLDGQRIGYQAIEQDPVLQKRHNSKIKMELMDNWRDQMVAQVKGERNHPSINLWSIENEFLFINGINLYRDRMDQFEAEVTKVSDAVLQADPTRLTMVDGGGATKAQTLPIHGDHYVAGLSAKPGRYPDLAYQANPTGGGRERWQWDQKRPRFVGEDYFANGINPFDYAYFGGETAFGGKAHARPAAGTIFRMLTQGYRWAEYGAWHFWMTQNEATNQYQSNAPLAVFCRQWDWTFASNATVKRTFGIFNDTRSSDPVIFTWTLTLNGKIVARQTTRHAVPAGHNKKFDASIPLPAVVARQEGQLTLTLSRAGKEVFQDIKAVSILPVAKPWSVAQAGRSSKTTSVAFSRSAPGTVKRVLVFDPHNTVGPFLRARGVSFAPVGSLDALPRDGKVLVVGPNALDQWESSAPRLAAYAAGGRSVVVLEQQHPLRYQGLPAEMKPETNEGRTAWVENLNHPVLRGLQQKDFFTWGPDEIVYRNAYQKPTRGGRSLVQVHGRLQNTALVEIPVANGLLLLSQLTIGEKLPSNAVAGQLLLNLLDYGARFKRPTRPIAAAIETDTPLARALDDMGLRYVRAQTPLQALGSPNVPIALIQATPANLETLATNPAKVDAFTKRGGTIVFNGLTPPGLAAYNKIVGFEHMIRPFGRERVAWGPIRHPLVAGLTTGDIVMLSGERIFDYTSDQYVASDVFSYVVDYQDVAPFATFESDFLRNMVNGMVSSDAWKYIVNVPIEPNKPVAFALRLPKPQRIVEVEWIGNTFYFPATKVELVADNNAPVTLAVAPHNDPQTLALRPPLVGKNITLRIVNWKTVANKQAVTGLDDIALRAERPPRFLETVKPLLNIGAMMEYKRGKGGIVLANLLFQDNEAVAENAGKKRTILATVLRNLQAPFADNQSVIAGADLHYEPIDLSKHANQYRNEKGWFGDRAFTFAALPSGKQTLAGVAFDLYDFETSPVPNAVMLGGPGVSDALPNEVRGIRVDRKADALFFLHAARLDRRLDDKERAQDKKYEMLRYVVLYEDGKSETVPVYAEIDIDDYKQKEPKAVSGALLAWTHPFTGTNFTAVAYAKPWNNPRPDVRIQSIDMEYGAHKRGVPVLLAITAATTNKNRNVKKAGRIGTP